MTDCLRKAMVHSPQIAWFIPKRVLHDRFEYCVTVLWSKRCYRYSPSPKAQCLIMRVFFSQYSYISNQYHLLFGTFTECLEGFDTIYIALKGHS